MSQKRRRYSAKEKMSALGKHFGEGVPVSDICEQMGIQPSLLYDWQRVLFSSAEQVFNRKPEAGLTRHIREVTELKTKLQHKDEVLAEVMAEYVALKKQWGGLRAGWVVPEVRAEVVEFVRYWQQRAELKVGQMLAWLGLGNRTYYSWQARQGQANQHNGQLPKAHWLLEWEQAAIAAYTRQHPTEGYRRLSYMMLDEKVVAVSPSSVYRVLQAAGLLQRWVRTASRKGQGFDQPSSIGISTLPT